MDPLSPVGISGLQSGFVLAVILLAVFFAERLGGSGQLAQRSFQVTLGLALMFVAISATTAFIRPVEQPEALQDAFFEESFTGEEDSESFRLFQETTQKTARQASEVRTIHTGLGLIFVVVGLTILGRLRVVPLGLALGGLLLLLFGGPQQQQGGFGGIFDFLSLFLGALAPGGSAGAGQARDIAHFGVLLAGVVALLAFGFLRWEGRREEAAATV